MKGFTVGSYLTRTYFLQMSGHLEKEKYQRCPQAFQNVSFLLLKEALGPSNAAIVGTVLGEAPSVV